jgi:biopolymer transport protein ExbD
MGMAASASKGGVKNDINITPLVDVVLVLLIIFMVVTPMLQRGRDVHLPKANKVAEEKKQVDPLVLSLTADHKIWVESKEFDEDSVGDKIAGEMAIDPNKRVLLKGDESVSMGDIRKLMDRAKKAGAKSVDLAVEEIKAK